jgi:hypothetical protein
MKIKEHCRGTPIPAITAAIILLFCSAGSLPLHATIVYSNDFNTGAASLTDFTIGHGSGYTGPYSVSVVAGQLEIDTYLPDPTAGCAAINNSVFSAPYSSTLKNNPGLVTWSFNVSNQDGVHNNKFFFSLASGTADPLIYTVPGYNFAGGGYVGDRMMLYNQTTGTPVIDIASTFGLAPLPMKGSFRITYDPATDRWSVYGVTGPSYVDPTTVTNLLGSAVDSTSTSTPLPFMCIGGQETGSAFFDNVTVSVIPEPGSNLLVAVGLFVALGLLHQPEIRKDQALKCSTAW